MIFLTAFIGAIFELLKTTLFLYYLAGAFVAFSFVLVGYMIRKIGNGGN